MVVKLGWLKLAKRKKKRKKTRDELPKEGESLCEREGVGGREERKKKRLPCLGKTIS